MPVAMGTVGNLTVAHPTGMTSQSCRVGECQLAHLLRGCNRPNVDRSGLSPKPEDRWDEPSESRHLLARHTKPASPSRPRCCANLRLARNHISSFAGSSPLRRAI